MWELDGRCPENKNQTKNNYITKLLDSSIKHKIKTKLFLQSRRWDGQTRGGTNSLCYFPPVEAHGLVKFESEVYSSISLIKSLVSSWRYNFRMFQKLVLGSVLLWVMFGYLSPGVLLSCILSPVYVEKLVLHHPPHTAATLCSVQAHRAKKTWTEHPRTTS